MATKKRKALFVIVEGDSDRFFFFNELEKVNKEEHVLIKSYDGDIFTDWDKKDIPIRDRIRSFFVERMGELRVSDFLGILHFTDTDASLISDDKIIIDLQQKELKIYKEQGIFVNSAEQHAKMIVRNQLKKERTSNARFLSYITYNKKEIPYRLFYLSQNLEHVVFNELNIPGNEKIAKVVRFLKEQGSNYSIESLLKDQFPTMPDETGSKHVESWNYIYRDNNSLQRVTNALLMYDYIEQLLKSK